MSMYVCMLLHTSLSSDFRTRLLIFFEVGMNVMLLQISQRLYILNSLMLMTWNLRVADTSSCLF
jgi:hypothetical protein